MIGTHPNVGFKFGRWLDTVMMQRALGEGAETCRRPNRPCIVTADIFGITGARPLPWGEVKRKYRYTTASLRSITSSTRSSSWPRRRISPLAEITL